MGAPCRPAVVAVALAVLAGGPVLVQGPASPSQPPTSFIDITALDSSGRPVTDLGVADVRVTIDGRPRAVRSMLRVFRGAGVLEAARDALSSGRAAAVPSRVILVAVDERTIDRGREKTVASGAWRVIDGLTPVDRVGVIALPFPRGNTQLSDDREHVRKALASLVGQAPRDTRFAALDTDRLSTPFARPARPARGRTGPTGRRAADRHGAAPGAGRTAGRAPGRALGARSGRVAFVAGHAQRRPLRGR